MVRCTDIDGEPVGHSGNKDAHERHKQLRKDSLSLRGKKTEREGLFCKFSTKKDLIIFNDGLEKYTPRPVEENLLWQANARDKVRSGKSVR